MHGRGAFLWCYYSHSYIMLANTCHYQKLAFNCDDIDKETFFRMLKYFLDFYCTTGILLTTPHLRHMAYRDDQIYSCALNENHQEKMKRLNTIVFNRSRKSTSISKFASEK